MSIATCCRSGRLTTELGRRARVVSFSIWESESWPRPEACGVWSASWSPERSVRNISGMLRLSCVVCSFGVRGAETLLLGFPIINSGGCFPLKAAVSPRIAGALYSGGHSGFQPSHAPPLFSFIEKSYSYPGLLVSLLLHTVAILYRVPKFSVGAQALIFMFCTMLMALFY